MLPASDTFPLMKPAGSIEGTPLEHCTIGEFVDVLGSDAMLPGAGAAGGVALALAAACAAKAVAITHAHHATPVLATLHRRMTEMARHALVLGQRDASQFRQQLQSKEPEAIAALLHTDHTILDLCRILERLLQDNAQLIAANMAGDWKAARALLHSCREIHTENLRELEDQ